MNQIRFLRPTSTLGIALVCAFLLNGCKKEKTSVATGQTVEVTAVKVEPRTVPITFEWIAQTESSRQVEIRARVDGILEKRVYREGSLVHEGEVMFEMERKPFEARLALAKAELGEQEARLANARQTLARVKDLSQKSVVSRQDLDDATNSERAAAAAVEAAKAKVTEAELNLSYTTVRAPDHRAIVLRDQTRWQLHWSGSGQHADLCGCAGSDSSELQRVGESTVGFSRGDQFGPLGSSSG